MAVRRPAAALPLVQAVITQPATVRWTLARARGAGLVSCRRPPSAGAPLAGAPVATGSLRTGRRLARGGYAADWRLTSGPSSLPAGAYVLTVGAADEHGEGPARSLALVVRR